MTDLLIVDNLHCLGLEAVSLRVSAGTCIDVTGASGSGKTLLLRAIADLDENVGDIHLDGQTRADVPAPQWRQRVGYVPAESGWWRDRVGDHFPEPDRVAGLLNRLHLPNECMDWPVARLSTGERQRLALIRTLAQTPQVLLLDEPTSGLDPDTTLRVEAILRENLASGAAIIVVSHDEAQAARMATVRYRMVSGRLRLVGDA